MSGFYTDQLPKQNGNETLFYASHIDKLHDPIRSTRWRMRFGADLFKAIGINYSVGNGNYYESSEKPDDFTLHIVGGAKIPHVTTAKDSIHYMGFEKKYPTGQEGLAGSIDLDALMTEDLRAYETVMLWSQRCYNQGVLNTTGEGESIGADKNRLEHVDDNGGVSTYLGLGQQENISSLNTNETYKVLRNSTVTLEVYDWNFGRLLMGVRFINAWPSDVGPTAELGYESAQLMHFTFKLDYDRFNIWINPSYQHMIG